MILTRDHFNTQQRQKFQSMRVVIYPGYLPIIHSEAHISKEKRIRELWGRVSPRPKGQLNA